MDFLEFDMRRIPQASVGKAEIKHKPSRLLDWYAIGKASELSESLQFAPHSVNL